MLNLIFINEKIEKKILKKKYKRCRRCKHFHNGNIFIWCDARMKYDCIIQPIKLICFKFERKERNKNARN